MSYEINNYEKDLESMSFRKIVLPDYTSKFIPNDVNLKFPETTHLNKDRLHFLVSIPWEDKYYAYIDEKYRDFFKLVAPFTSIRTTDVHIAKCFPFLKEMIEKIGNQVDENIVSLGFILHDCGWGKMNEEEIAASLGVKGLALAGDAVSPKQKHAELGNEIAKDILGKSEFSETLTNNQKKIIYNAVLLHDSPEKINSDGEIPLEIKIICDVDHLWSFTHENFWQDTVRKNVNPEDYLNNLENDLGGYFIMEESKEKARSLLKEREREVSVWKKISKK